MGSIFELFAACNFGPIALRILLSTLIGGCMGFERGRHGHAAGMRTHILVCLGAAVTVMVGIFSAKELGFNSDPMRISAQVISGIGFLGAGIILPRNHNYVKGVTTAAGLWTTACIGLAVGAGFYMGAILAAATMMAAITFFTKLENLGKRKHARIYYLEFDSSCKINQFARINRAKISSLQIVPARSGLPLHVGLEVSLREDMDIDTILDQFDADHSIVIAIAI